MSQHHLIPSRAMGRPINLWRFGHWGLPVLVFPSAAGMAHEWRSQGMLEALSHLLGSGKIKLYCAESNVAEAWTRKDHPPDHRIRRHMAYERFVVEELVPFIRADCHGPNLPIGVTGCSLGAFYAANFALKFPHIFNYALCMSGRYEARHFTDGFSNQDVYFNNPLAFVPNLSGGELERVRGNTFLSLVCGQGKWEEGCIEETHALADVLSAKRIHHHRDIWGHDVSHDWVWWQRQARHHLGQRYSG
ncbi:MAG: alpha/beta hydrolase-fold protein [Acidobacteriota bacterium]